MTPTDLTALAREALAQEPATGPGGKLRAIRLLRDWTRGDETVKGLRPLIDAVGRALDPTATLTRAAKERAVAEMASRLAAIAENTGYADLGKIPDVDYFHRRQRTLRAALVRLAMARTVD